MRKDSEIWIMLIIAACTIAGIAFIEAVTMPFGPRAVLTLVFIAIFAGLLSPQGEAIAEGLGRRRRLSADCPCYRVMSLGDSWMLGGILFFIICASLSYELSLPFVTRERRGLSLGACLLPDRRAEKFDLGVLPFCLGISSISALSVLLNRARKAREESLTSSASSRRLKAGSEISRFSRSASASRGDARRGRAPPHRLGRPARGRCAADPDRAYPRGPHGRDLARPGARRLAELRTA